MSSLLLRLCTLAVAASSVASTMMMTTPYDKLCGPCMPYLNGADPTAYPGDECCAAFAQLTAAERDEALFRLWDNRPSYSFTQCNV